MHAIADEIVEGSVRGNAQNRRSIGRPVPGGHIRPAVRVTSLVLFYALLFPLRAGATVYPLGTFMVVGTYEGVLPCADCNAVRTRVTLDSNCVNLSCGYGAFVMEERFEGGARRGRAVTTRGSWRALAEFFYSPKIELQSDDGKGGSRFRYFVCDRGRALHLLNDDLQPVIGPNTVLTRAGVTTPQSPPT